ncbi:MAG TPA: TetR/AcrR family transcriptional regulator [Candidatus Thermoplasmatota archaeon]|nr:TetR/AcrR family transcriptional regulator [Candidatus Thermoplasmatota archaeon]
MSRDRILDAAFSLLARAGPTKPDQVARVAGVSKALVYHHFRTVEGLHDAMAERVLRETQAGLDALARDHPNPRDRIEALARALLAEPPDPPAATLQIVRFWLDDDGRGAARASLRDALVADFVRATLKEARYGGDGARVAAMLLARWHGATLVYATGGAVDFDAEAERAAAELERMTSR